MQSNTEDPLVGAPIIHFPDPDENFDSTSNEGLILTETAHHEEVVEDDAGPAVSPRQGFMDPVDFMQANVEHHAAARQRKKKASLLKNKRIFQPSQHHQKGGGGRGIMGKWRNFAKIPEITIENYLNALKIISFLKALKPLYCCMYNYRYNL